MTLELAPRAVQFSKTGAVWPLQGDFEKQYGNYLFHKNGS